VTLRTTVVVGGGSSGGVIASRLSEDPRERVVLFEAGPDYRPGEAMPPSLRDVYNPQLRGEHDWGFEAHFVEPAGARNLVPYPRGRVMGGSSTINGSLAQRGTPEDFDAWARDGHHEWSWDRVLPFYKRLETDLDFGESELHGGAGPIPIARKPREEWTSDQRAMVEACVGLGYGFAPDLAGFEQGVVGPTPRNQVGEEYRAGTLVTYLKQARGRDNLELHPDTLVVRVVFDGEVAVGVEVDRSGSREVVAADRVVLAGGAICSPQILTLSGIGPREALDRLGIAPIVVAPGVGRNLRDQVFAPVLALPTKEEEYFGFRLMLKCNSGGEFPNDQLIACSYIAAASMNWDFDGGATAAVMLCPMVGKPESVGWLDVTSKDPRVQPEMHMNFLDGSTGDMERLEQVVRLCRQLTDTSPLAEEVTVLSPSATVMTSDEALREWLRQNAATGYHGAGTCRIGVEGDEGAVVDQRLAVHGTRGLYVADASIMPHITTGFTNLSCIMIGERMAAWLRDR